MLNHILVGSDLSERSRPALARAAVLADAFGARLTVLHVLDGDLPARLRERLEDDARAMLDDAVSGLAIEDRTRVEIAAGDPHAVLIDRAASLGADLTVMGRHRYRPVRDLFVGTTVERVLRSGETPVLVVREAVRGPYRHAMVAVDFSVYSRRAAAVALEIVPDGAVTALHACDLPVPAGEDGWLPAPGGRLAESIEMEMTALKDGLGPAAARLTPVVRLGGVVDTIQRAVERFAPDLVVVGTHGRTGVAHALLGSVAGTLLADPPVDVLAVRAW